MNDTGLALYAGRDEFSLHEAADLWAGLLPTMRRREREACPERAAAAREWLRVLLAAAQAGQLQASPCRVTPPIRTAGANPRPVSGSLQDLLRYRARQLQAAPVAAVVPGVRIEKNARATRAALVAYAMTLPNDGGQPAFLFGVGNAEAPEDPRTRNRRIAAAVIDGRMARDQALAEVEIHNLKRILAAERRRRRMQAGSPETTGHPVAAWNTAKPYPKKNTRGQQS